jgi:hypothetical protein
MPNWQLDNNYNLDQSFNTVEEIELEETVVTQMTYHPLYDREDELIFEDELVVLHSVALDLMQLVPAKFRNSQILIDYLAEAGLLIGDQLTKIRDLPKLLGPNTVTSMTYLRYLGALIGVNFPPEDETSEEEMYKTLIYAIDWYKVKGTYHSLAIIALIQSFTINIYDMYTEDYVNFDLVEWWVGRENVNPPGVLGFKSPHFAVEILLNQVREEIVGSGVYLWLASALDNMYSKVEETRPVHTVPHYMLLMTPKTDEFGNVIEVDGDIQTKILTVNWVTGTRYFDMLQSGTVWNFDDGANFDESAEGFLKSITKFVFGTGTCDLNDPGADIQDYAFEGVINPDNIIIGKDKITFEFIVPRVVEQDGLTELGLYVPGAPDTLVILANFPKIDKDNRVEIHVILEVFKKDLS